MKRFSYVSSTLAATLVAAGLIAWGLIVTPVAHAVGPCVDEMTAGGWVEDGGPDLFANFGLNAKSDNGVLSGELNFVDADEECHVVGEEVLSYTVLDESCREIVYAVTVNDVAGFTADVIVCDYGEPNTDDTFSIEVSNASGEVVDTCSVSGTVVGGNVQLHVHGDCN